MRTRTVIALSSLLSSPVLAQDGLYFSEVGAAAGARVVHEFFYDYGDPGSIPIQLRMSGGVAAGDFDRDGDTDLYVITGDRTPNALLVNDGQGRFTDRAAEAGVGLDGRLGNGPVFADVDADGWLDLVVGGMEGSGMTIWRNLGDGRFEDVTDISGVVRENEFQHDFSTAFGDPDGDGDLDMVVAHWGATGPTTHLWLNRGDGRFVGADGASGLAGAFADKDWSFAPAFADIDADGRPDLLMANDFGTSQVWRNVDGLRFENIATPVIDDRNGMGSAVADIDNDGDLDWFVTSIWYGDGTPGEGNRLYLNDGQGTFSSEADQSGVIAGDWGWSACAADFDNDGWLDLFHVNGMVTDVDPIFNSDLSRLFMNNGSGQFTEQAVALGINERDQGRGLVCFDADGDGDIDLFTMNLMGESHLYRNELSPNPGWFQLSLSGEPNNPFAVGARITLTAGGVTQTREVSVRSNYQSQDPLLQHFGLGGAERVDQLRVQWPHGGVTVLSDLEPNQRLTLSIAAADPAPFVLEPAASSAWYDPERDGEGFILELLPGGLAALYWFTYDDAGEQDWLIGVGRLEGRRILFDRLQRLSGGVFGPDFDPALVTRDVVGSAAFTWDDCDTGQMNWAIADRVGQQALRRLTRPLGLGCGQDGIVGGDAGLSGAWFDPTHDGEGFTVEALPDGKAVAYWFTFSPEGERRWVFGIGDREEGRWVFERMVSTRGARFGEAFDADDVEITDWGRLEMTLDCEGGTARWTATETGFMDGAFDLDRLTQLDGTACP